MIKLTENKTNKSDPKNKQKETDAQDNDGKSKVNVRHFKDDVMSKSSKKQESKDSNRPSSQSRNFFQKKETHVGKRNQKENKHFASDLPKVWAIHDSVLKKIDRRRLGHGYGFDLHMSKAYTIKEAKAELLKQCDYDPDTILLHVGVNDLQRDSAENCSTATLDLVDVACELYPKSKVVISHVAPTSMPDLQTKCNLFNALNASKLLKKRNVSFVSHANLKTDTSRLQPDKIHPTDRGVSVIAGNIGRHIHYMYWEKVEPRRQRLPRLNDEYHQHRDWHYRTFHPAMAPWMFY